ncbi:hypothetical protein M231_02176 [Tremella mesenterica]|uniref:ATP-dependent DNA helicase II subunit 1 n=1 Tax=Tremella mesenterica TaxID=5217 RepID=A0A4Q1BRE1_TREME|nr:hypothetical protein M231_02176 [Tremella mesenterica]
MTSYYNDRTRDIPSWEDLQQDDEDVVDISEYQYASRDHILFCVDASRSMQTPHPDQETPDGLIRGKSALHQVLEAVVKIQRSKVITGPADSVGVLLWNVNPATAPKSASGNYKPGTLVYQSLRTINAEEIKRILKLVERANGQYEEQHEDDSTPTVEPEALVEAFPPCAEGEQLNIADVLVTCNFLFRDAGTKLAGNKRVFLVTDQDQPPGASSNREPARTVYGDLMTYGITINTYFVDRPDHRFNPTLYWNDILNREDNDGAPGDDDPPDIDGLAQLADVMNDLVIRHAPKRKQFSIPLKFGGKDGEIEIGVSGYSLVSSQGKGQPKYVRMRGQQVEEVLTKTEYTSAETGAILREEEIGQAFQFGNESTVKNVLEPNWWETNAFEQEQQALADEAIRLDQERREREDDEDESMKEREKDLRTKAVAVDGAHPKVVARTRLQFTSSEVAELRSLGLPTGIKILGFQSPQNLKFDENIRHSFFLYPDESTYSGSTRTFAALLKSCLKYNRHALALCRFKRNSTPEFAVLIPQEETFTKEGGQDRPPGFHVIILPYRDDIRGAPKNMTDNLSATERQAQLMSNIVKRLRIKAGHYRSEVYPNPSLAYHYAQIQALAFEEDFDPSTATDLDKTVPKYRGMHKAAGDFMKEWNMSIREDERAVESLTMAHKRSTAVEIDEDDLADVAGAFAKGELTKVISVFYPPFIPVVSLVV